MIHFYIFRIREAKLKLWPTVTVWHLGVGHVLPIIPHSDSMKLLYPTQSLRNYFGISPYCRQPFPLQINVNLFIKKALSQMQWHTKHYANCHKTMWYCVVERPSIQFTDINVHQFSEGSTGQYVRHPGGSHPIHWPGSVCHLPCFIFNF